MKAAQHTTRITNAGVSQQEDVKGRMIRYSITMGVRMLCFLGAILAFRSAPWLAGVLVVAAVILPYIAVMFANIGPAKPDPAADTLLDGPPPERLDEHHAATPEGPSAQRYANRPGDSTENSAAVVIPGQVLGALESRRGPEA